VVGSISKVLDGAEPLTRVASETAAVAAIFGNSSGREVLLLIRRSERSGDPWSGQVALPGGRVEDADGSFRETAIRETREEVGIDLDADSRFLGYLGRFRARSRGVWVVPSVFMLERIPVVTPNREVASYKWMSFSEFLVPESRSTYNLSREGRSRSFPAFKLDDYLVWGLTERIVSALADAVRRDAAASSRDIP